MNKTDLIYKIESLTQIVSSNEGAVELSYHVIKKANMIKVLKWT